MILKKLSVLTDFEAPSLRMIDRVARSKQHGRPPQGGNLSQSDREHIVFPSSDLR